MATETSRKRRGRKQRVPETKGCGCGREHHDLVMIGEEQAITLAAGVKSSPPVLLTMDWDRGEMGLFVLSRAPPHGREEPV
jgi:hypothetical protein